MRRFLLLCFPISILFLALMACGKGAGSSTLGPPATVTLTSSTATFASVNRPAGTLYLSESGDKNHDRSTHPWMIFLQDGSLDDDALAELKEDTASQRHLGGANYLFTDWHVKWLRFEATYSPNFLYDPRN